MQEFGNAFTLAFALMFSRDADLLEIIGLSLRASLTAVVVSCAVGLRPVVVGLMAYMILSNAGPFGWLQLLYTPTTTIIAQTVLITPTVAAVSTQVISDLHAQYAEQFRSLSVPAHRAVAVLPPLQCCPKPTPGKLKGWPRQVQFWTASLH